MMIWCILFAAVSFSAVAVSGQNFSSVSYLLWTRNNPGDGDSFLLDVNLNKLTNSPFDENLRTLLLIHGWMDTGTNQWILDAKNNYLTVLNCNVISVDWQQIASTLNYEKAALEMYGVAIRTAGMLDLLVGKTALTTSMIHVIGHSLGGQMAGMIGKYITNGTLYRVTGLDPAGPLFDTKSSNKRIDKSDAAFVDIIHTNSGTLFEGCLGFFPAVGDVDFYPNGGKHQPGCFFSDFVSPCSHIRAFDYWVESILAGQSSQYPKEFWAWPCSDYETFQSGGCSTCGQGCSKMGFWVDRNISGSYYLNTNENSPFAKGQNQ